MLSLCAWLKHSQRKHKGNNDTDTPVIPPNSPWWKFPRLENCQFEYSSHNHFYEFTSPQSFSFVELMGDGDTPIQHFDGLVRLKAPSGHQEAAIVVGVSIATTKEFDISHLNVRQSEDSFTLHGPSFSPMGDDFEKACMVKYRSGS